MHSRCGPEEPEGEAGHLVVVNVAVALGVDDAVGTVLVVVVRAVRRPVGCGLYAAGCKIY